MHFCVSVFYIFKSVYLDNQGQCNTNWHKLFKVKIKNLRYFFPNGIELSMQINDIQVR